MFSESVRESIRAQIDAMNRADEKRNMETWALIARIKAGEKIEVELPQFRIPFSFVQRC